MASIPAMDYTQSVAILGFILAGISLSLAVLNGWFWIKKRQLKLQGAMSLISFWGFGYILLTALEYLAPSLGVYLLLLRIQSVFTFLFFPSCLFLFSLVGIKASLLEKIVWIAPQLLYFLFRQTMGMEAVYDGPLSFQMAFDTFPGLPHAVVSGKANAFFIAFLYHTIAFTFYLFFKSLDAHVKRKTPLTLGLVLSISLFLLGVMTDTLIILVPLSWFYVTDFAYLGFIIFFGSYTLNLLLEGYYAKNSLDSLQEAVSQMDVLLFLTDLEGKIIYQNKTAENFFPRRKPRLGEVLREWYLDVGGNPERLGWLSKLRKQGVIHDRWELGGRTVAGVLGVFRNETGKPDGYYGVFREITLEKALEEKFHKIQRMDTISASVSVLAHDFRNNLHAIMMSLDYAKLLVEDLGEIGTKVRDAITTTQKPLQTALNHAQKILALGQEQDDLKEVNICSLVLEAVELSKAYMDVSVVMETVLKVEEIKIEADAEALRQVVINLIQNAVNAIRIKRENGKPAEERITVTLSPEAPDSVRLSVADTGIGMGKETLEKLFTPFFTTRADSGGTGLGLLQVLNTVKRFKGRIEVESEVNKGTSFHLFFPAL